MIQHISKYGITLLFLVLAVQLFAQKTIVSGTVVDAETKEPIPFANVAFKGSKIGTVTDFDGKYFLETYYPADSLAASFVGYLPKAYKIKQDEEQTINFQLKTGSIQLQEIVIKRDKKAENPAHPIFRNVIKYKDANNREKLAAYEYEVYNKVEFDINNIDEEYKNKKLFKPFQFIFENIDTTDEKPYLPMFITEAVADFHYRKEPKSEREIIKATKVSGIKNESVQQFLGDMYQNVNIYDNYITVFGKSFVSPVADFGLLTYRYYLMDSALIDNKWCYKLKFTPRRKHELTFDGDMWISDTTYAVKQIQATVSGDANINFINDFAVYQEYNEVEKEVWLLTRDELLVDFTVSNKSIGFYGRKTSTYKDFVVNKPRDDEFFAGAENIIVNEDAGKKDAEYWQSARHVELTEQEEKIYQMIDTLQQVPAFKSYVDVIQLIVTGYKVWGNVEIGPYFTMYSFNAVEGHRFKLGGRTSNQFSTKVEFSGHIAYGTKDQKFKYDAGFRWRLSDKPRQILTGFFAHDVEQLGQSENAWQQDNIIASVFRRTPFNKLNGYQQYSMKYEFEWFQGFTNTVELLHRNIWPLGVLQFDYVNDAGMVENIPNIRTSEVRFYTRFAYKEKYISGNFDRVSLGTKFPTIQTMYAYGFPGVLGSQYEYHKAKLNISDKIRMGMFGYSEIIGEVGKTWGGPPYPLLQLHNGNETYSYDMSAYNLMNYYEFVSDEYASLSITHHFNGMFLNKIPLLRKLKWREVASAKGVAGSLDQSTYDRMRLPGTLSTLTKPYYEAGVGIENIFQILRIDFLWRMSYVSDEYVNAYEAVSSQDSDIAKWGIRGMLQFDF